MDAAVLVGRLAFCWLKTGVLLLLPKAAEVRFDKCMPCVAAAAFAAAAVIHA
jgi:hypothetical protein